MPCAECKTDTWHYKQANGTIKCCVHDNNLVQGSTDPALPKINYSKHVGNKLDMSMWRGGLPANAKFVDPTKYSKYFPGEESTEVEPGKLYCTHCGSPVDHITKLSESKPRIRKFSEPVKIGDNIVFREKVSVVAEEVHACQKCVLQIRKPIVLRTV